MSLRNGFKMLKSAALGFSNDDAMTLAGALAFCAALALAPLLMILLAVTSLLGPDIQQQVIQQVRNVSGEQAGSVIGQIVQRGRQPPFAGLIAALVGFAVLLFSASGAFVQMQHSLNRIWNVEPKSGGVWPGLRKRVLSLLLILGIGLILLLSLGVSAALAMVFAGTRGHLWQIVNAVGMLIIYTLLFALIYKILPDVQIAWKDVGWGAIVTSFLFEIGRYLIGLYLGRSGVGSPYGAAGSLVALLVWVYYASIIFFFGAELTQSYAAFHGRQLQPDEYARQTPEAEEKRRRELQETHR